MNTIRGRTAAMYVKFCSGPTPRYTPSGFTRETSSGITSWKRPSFEMKLSE